MSKPKAKPAPRAYVWMIFDPETGLYYKCTPNAHYGNWVRIPYGYGSEKTLMKALERIRNYNPQAQVVPYSLVDSCIVDVAHYGL